jgi:hypothetical protein
MRFQFKQLFCLVLLGIMISGCTGDTGKAKPRAKVYKTKGKVTFLGSPVISAVVSFSPKGDQPAAIGRTNDAGEFTLTTYSAGDGAAAGDFAVMVMLIDSGGAEKTPEAAHFKTQAEYVPTDTHNAKKSAKASGNVLPAKYADPKTSPLSAKVEAGKDNNFVLEVK